MTPEQLIVSQFDEVRRAATESSRKYIALVALLVEKGVFDFDELERKELEITSEFDQLLEDHLRRNTP